jgi:hypothetical protein
MTDAAIGGASSEAIAHPGGGSPFAWMIAIALIGVIGLVSIPAVLVTTILGGGSHATIGTGAGMPPGAQPFLRVYEDAAKVFHVSPYLLMATHEDETAFSTSTQPGVSLGVNFANCCAGPMQFFIAAGASPAQGGAGGTWAGYRLASKRATIERPADYPGRYTAPAYASPNVYDSFDALYAAADYFHDEGAGPDLDDRTYGALLNYKGTPPASIPYARHDYERAKELQRIAEANGDGAVTAPPAFGTEMAKLGRMDPWLATVPGYPGEKCDRRILPNLLYLIDRYKLAVTDCYALAGHEAGGEHPLGLGVDLVPGHGGSWDLVARLAAAAEPEQNQPVAPFRWVGWNGDAGHGDPAHAGSNAHLHLSWLHAAAAFGQQADWVEVAR